MFKNLKTYGDNLNSYDALKLIALLTMVVDHVGAYFLPDTEWLRALGRMAFPLFLFLVGYSAHWKIRADLVIWAILVILCAALTHHPIFPLNILVTIIITRYAMRYVTRHELTPKFLRGIFVVCLFWWPLFYWHDYSTIALLFAICGFLQKKYPGTNTALIFLYSTIASHFFLEGLGFGFHQISSIVIMLLGAFSLVYIMQNFRLQNFNTLKNPDRLRHNLQWIARNTLPLYGLHLMAFMILERHYFPERLAEFRWF